VPRRKANEENEPEGDAEFESSARVTRAWASAPQPWREVQTEQLNDAVAQLRRGGEVDEEEPPKRPRRSWRFRLVRRLSH